MARAIAVDRSSEGWQWILKQVQDDKGWDDAPQPTSAYVG